MITTKQNSILNPIKTFFIPTPPAEKIYSVFIKKEKWLRKAVAIRRLQNLSCIPSNAIVMRWLAKE